LSLLDRVGEVCQDEFVSALDAGEDNLFEHLDDQVVEIAKVVLARANLLINFASNLSVSLRLFLDQLEDVQLLKALGGLEGSDDFLALLVGGIGATGSNEEDSWLDEGAQLLEGLFEVLFRVNAAQVG